MSTHKANFLNVRIKLLLFLSVVVPNGKMFLFMQNPTPRWVTSVNALPPVAGTLGQPALVPFRSCEHGTV